MLKRFFLLLHNDGFRSLEGNHNLATKSYTILNLSYLMEVSLDSKYMGLVCPVVEYFTDVRSLFGTFLYMASFSSFLVKKLFEGFLSLMRKSKALGCPWTLGGFLKIKSSERALWIASSLTQKPRTLPINKNKKVITLNPPANALGENAWILRDQKPLPFFVQPGLPNCQAKGLPTASNANWKQFIGS